MNPAFPLIALLLLAAAGCRSFHASAALPEPPAVSVTVLDATMSAPDPAERRIATRAADRIAGLLAREGLAVRRMTEETLIQRGAPDRLVLLPYNPALPPAAQRRLRAHLEHGGHLIVFYSASAELAAAMGFELEPPARADAGAWSEIVFARDRPALLPDRIRQSSRILRPARPAAPDARLLARWEDPDGVLPPKPAWSLSARGAWMSHVLQEGESDSRRRLLLGLAAHFEPRVLQAAAAQAVARAGAAAPYDTGDALLAAWRRKPGLGPIAASGFAAERNALAALYRQGRYAETLVREARLGASLAAACARAVPPAAGEFRAVWNHSGLGLVPGTNGWAQTARRLAEHGFHAVFPQAAWAGAVLYPGGRLPQSEAGRAAGDPLGACCQAAREAGLAVHAWKICWSLGPAPAAAVERLRAAGRLQVNAVGETLPWLCPSQRENVESELAVVAEIASRYPVQGIHLDYIRFADKQTCCCPVCRAGFERARGVRVARWPEEALQGPLAASFRRWRAGQIARFVRLARARLRAVRPDAALSAAVYGWYPGCIDSLGQDWVGWLARGDLDFVCPMNYTADTAQFAGWLAGQLPRVGDRSRLIPGIGVTANESRLNGLQALDQILAARQAGAAGFILFDLTDALDRELLPLLRLGAAAP